MSDTIAAIATGGVVAAIGIIRVSGPGAIAAADMIFRAAGGIRLKDAECRRMYYGELTGADGNLLDLCLCFISRAPHSYTGEDTAEFHCHGSPMVQAEVLRALFKQGVRQALPGEFTKRAFLSGRMDLTQAEAVIDIIESSTPGAARNAAGQLRGAIGLRLDSVYSALLDVMAHFHAVIDYPDEDIDDFEMRRHLSALREVEGELTRMASTYDRGKVLRDGVPAVIAGRPNTGKSSLLNALLGYERAIVTAFPGTTRDTLEEKILIGGVLLRITDTAGIRDAEDAVEKLGVERTRDALGGAGLAIIVLDGSQPLQDEDFDALSSIPQDTPKLAVVNKSDLPQIIRSSELDGMGLEYCNVSALTGFGLDSLEAKINKLLKEDAAPPDGGIVTNMRQYDAILRSKSSVGRAIEAIEATVTPDAVLTDVEAALEAIGEVTGKTMREDITDRIFERFCVGK